MFKTTLRKEVWLSVLILVIAGAFVYSFNLNNQLFWDDDEWIVNNVFVHDVSWSNIRFWFNNNTLAGVGLKSNYYRPFLFFTFALNYVIAGIKPLAYHLTGNAIHVFNGILVFWLIRQAFKRNLLAFLVSLLFLIHPLQTEAITYISGRGDSLVAMFMLLALLSFLKSNDSEIKRSDLSLAKVGPWKMLSLAALILALLSRETAIIFPFLALLLYVSFLSKDRFIKSIKSGLIKTWPYFAIIIIYGILRLTILNFLNTLNFYLEPNVYSENLHVRMFTFLPILWEYIKILFVPVGLHMERGAIVYTSLFQWPVWAVFLGLVGLLVWLRYLYKKYQISNLKSQINSNYQNSKQNWKLPALGRVETRPGKIENWDFPKISDFKVWFFGSFWFFIALGPVSGITPINALIYEHWLYLPMVGFWLVVSFYLIKLFDYLKKTQKLLFVICVLLFGAYVSFYGFQSIKRNMLWGNSAEFYKDILKHEPDSARINNNLGNVYFNQGDREQAEFYYRKAVELGDAFAQPYYNLGSILQSRGDIYGAMQLYEEAIKINPNFHYPYQNLAVIYAQQGNLIKAVENIEVLKSLLPNNPRVYYNSALIYIALNNKEQALKDLQSGLKYADLDLQTGELMSELIKELQN